MRRQRVESTSVESVGYDAGTAVLEIAFREGGVYRYFQVPPSVHRELMAAESMGRYVNQSIKPRYRFDRVD